MLSNPPFGVDWKKVEGGVKDEHKLKGFDGRFGSGATGSGMENVKAPNKRASGNPPRPLKRPTLPKGEYSEDDTRPLGGSRGTSGEGEHV